MEKEDKILKEIQQSNKAVLSLLANQNKLNAMRFDALDERIGSLDGKVGSLSTQVNSFKVDIHGIHGEIKNINISLQIITEKVERVECAVLDTRKIVDENTKDIKQIKHVVNHHLETTIHK